jgi:hypothetical protein
MSRIMAAVALISGETPKRTEPKITIGSVWSEIGVKDV